MNDPYCRLPDGANGTSQDNFPVKEGLCECSGD